MMKEKDSIGSILRPQNQGMPDLIGDSPDQRASTKRTSPYDAAFEQHLIDFEIFPDEYHIRDSGNLPIPDNLDEIRQILKNSRLSLPSIEISDSEFRAFQRSNAQSLKEWEVLQFLAPFLDGDTRESQYVTGQTLFNNLANISDGTITSGSPDRYYGARPGMLSRHIRNELDKFIIPSTKRHLPIIPNFFLEVKGPEGSAAVVKRQACYHGALGARAMQRIQSYKAAKQVYDNRAYTITGTYHDGQLRLYTSHPIRPDDPVLPSGYMMTQINSWSLTGNVTQFQEGVAAYRNARDWAKLQRDEAIMKANRKTPEE
jgi:hypothetical protein